MDSINAGLQNNLDALGWASVAEGGKVVRKTRTSGAKSRVSEYRGFEQCTALIHRHPLLQRGINKILTMQNPNGTRRCRHFRGTGRSKQGHPVLLYVQEENPRRQTFSQTSCFGPWVRLLHVSRLSLESS